MAQMRVALTAQHFCAVHEEAHIGLFSDVVVHGGLPETGPSGAGFELGAGFEQGQRAEPAGVDSRFFVVEQAAAEWALRAVVEEDVAFFRREALREAVAFGGAERVERVAGAGDGRHAPL